MAQARNLRLARVDPGGGFNLWGLNLPHQSSVMHILYCQWYRTTPTAIDVTSCGCSNTILEPREESPSSEIAFQDISKNLFFQLPSFMQDDRKFHRHTHSNTSFRFLVTYSHSTCMVPLFGSFTSVQT